MVRAALQALAIGTAAAANGWEVANTLPNIVYLLLAGGVLNAVLVPQITRSAAHADGGRDYVDRLLTLAIGGIALVTVLITAAAPLLVRLYASTLDPATLHLSVTFAFICLPQIFFYGLYTVLGQVLNARGHFAAFFWAPVAANVVFIAGLVAFIVLYPAQPSVADYTSPMIWLLAGSATLSIAAQGLILVAPLWRSGFRFRPRWGFRGVGLRGASTVALWTFAALAVSQLAFIVTSQVLGTVDGSDPGRASYSYAFLVFMLPHSLVTVSLVTALFTRMSRAAHSDNLREVRRDVHHGLRLTAVVNIPASIGGMLLGVYVTATLYILNSPEATRGIASIMIPMLAGLVPFGVVYLIQRVYYAFEDARTPFRLQVIISVVATVTGLGALLLPDPWIGFGIGVGQTREQPGRCGGRHHLGTPPPGRPAAGLDHPQLRAADPRLAGRRGPRRGAGLGGHAGRPRPCAGAGRAAGGRQRVRRRLPPDRPPAARPGGRRAARTAARSSAADPAGAVNAP